MQSFYNINRTNVLYTVQIKVRRDKERKVQEGEGTMSEFETLSNAATTGNLKEGVNMDWFFKDVRKRDYSLPKPLRGLFILAVNNSNANTLTVRMYERPTRIERAIRKYRLRGISVELETNADNVEAVFDRTFKVAIDVKPFLSNLTMFYKASIESLDQQEYGDEMEQRKIVKKQRTEQKLDSLIIYRKKIV